MLKRVSLGVFGACEFVQLKREGLGGIENDSALLKYVGNDGCELSVSS